MIDAQTALIADDGLRGKFKRLMSRNAAAGNAKKGRNWEPCKRCGVLCPPMHELCPVCAAAARLAGVLRVKSLLRDAPWLKYKNCVQYVACRPSDYAAAKEMLADELMAGLGVSDGDSVRLLALVMLLHGVEPRQVNQGMIEKTLAKVRRKKNVFTPRS